MARRVFFSFHFDRDIWRVNQVRNSWVTKADLEEAGYIDAASFEAVERRGQKAVERWIDDQLEGTSVTVVLIGTETSQRYYVNYEIIQSYNRGNGLLGIYIHNLKDLGRMSEPMGLNPFGNIQAQISGRQAFLSTVVPTYDWVHNNGYNNLGTWIEQAARQAGK